jgi:hypothetical protein
MPSPRIASGDQVTMAVDDLVGLGRHLPDLSVSSAGPGTVTFHLADDSWTAAVVTVDSAGVADVDRFIAVQESRPAVLVGNKISEEARARLSGAGWSWFDRRVGAHIAHGERTLDIRFVATDVAQANATTSLPLASPRSDGPIRGRAGISYAAMLLLDPEDPPSFRFVARETGMSPTAISNAARLLGDAGLVNADGTPALPDLFWALAEVWRPVKLVAVAAPPDPSSRKFDYEIPNVAVPGWAVGGDVAALALGAPLFTTDERPWFWVPTQTEARRAQRALGTAEWSDRRAAIAVPPTPLVTTRRIPSPDPKSQWPLVHPVFVALDLARDPGRGREILDQWAPEGITRVWA